jgi:cardiolipin synthase
MFVEEYLADLRRERFRPGAILRYARRALALARARAIANPGAVRSILLVALLLFLGSLACSIALALVVDGGLARRVFLWTAVGLFPMVGLTLLHVDLVRDREGFPLDAIGWPTAVTLLRLALVPAFLVFVVGGHHRLAFWTFVVGAASDIVDGWLARRFHQETRLGAILDPLSDILCSFWLFVGLYASQAISWVPFALAAARTALLLGGGVYLHAVHGAVRIHSTLPGKITGLVLASLVGARLFYSAYDVGQTARRLTPLIVDALTAMLAFTLFYGFAIGWMNLLRLRARGPLVDGKVVNDVRFGA